MRSHLGIRRSYCSRSEDSCQYCQKTFRCEKIDTAGEEAKIARKQNIQRPWNSTLVKYLIPARIATEIFISISFGYERLIASKNMCRQRLKIELWQEQWQPLETFMDVTEEWLIQLISISVSFGCEPLPRLESWRSAALPIWKRWFKKSRKWIKGLQE